MKLAIVGSVDLAGNAEAIAHIERALDKYQPTLVISGGADGIDTMAVRAASRCFRRKNATGSAASSPETSRSRKHATCWFESPRKAQRPMAAAGRATTRPVSANLPKNLSWPILSH